MSTAEGPQSDSNEGRNTEWRMRWETNGGANLRTDARSDAQTQMGRMAIVFPNNALET